MGLRQVWGHDQTVGLRRFPSRRVAYNTIYLRLCTVRAAAVARIMHTHSDTRLLCSQRWRLAAASEYSGTVVVPVGPVIACLIPAWRALGACQVEVLVAYALTFCEA